MGYSTWVRFCDPVDPRDIWRAVRVLVEAPDNYRWRCYAPGGDMGRDGCWFAEPEQGANSLACMYYGPEGSLLDDSEYSDPADGWQPSQIPPAGYVEVHMSAGYSCTDDLIRRAHLLVAAIGVQAAIRDDFTAEWTTVHPELINK